MARQADGRILVAGRSSSGGGVVARLRATGVLDPTSATGGRVTLPGAAASTASARAARIRNIIVADKRAVGAPRCTVTRLKPDGSLDTTFGSGGRRRSPSAPWPTPRRRGPPADGKIVIAGYTQDGEDVACARLNANGSLDAASEPGQGDRRLRGATVRQRGRAGAERAHRRRRPEDRRRRLRVARLRG
jgi:uncharacterized delta-60 repeat protein